MRMVELETHGHGGLFSTQSNAFVSHSSKRKTCQTLEINSVNMQSNPTKLISHQCRAINHYYIANDL